MAGITVSELRRRVEDEQFTGRRSFAATRLLRRHFSTQFRFTFEGLIGRGAFGATFRVVEKLQNDASRRLVVKRAIDDYGIDSLQTEIAVLRMLRGAEHIAKLIADRDESRPINIWGTRHIRRFVYRGFDGTVSASLVGLPGPVAVIEYLENGDLDRLHTRLSEHDFLLPNRILWSFFLCLIRACIALAYPINNPNPDAPTTLEDVPVDGRPEALIEHGDMHMGNVMIGDSGGFAEHTTIPVVKFIDFGMAGQGQGAAQNLFKSAQIMVELITRRPYAGLGTIYRGLQTMASEIVPDPTGRDPYPTLDPWIRDCLAQCLAVDPQLRPDLASALFTGEIGAALGAGAYQFPPETYVRESDELITHALKVLVFDAPN